MTYSRYSILSTRKYSIYLAFIIENHVTATLGEAIVKCETNQLADVKTATLTTVPHAHL